MITWREFSQAQPELAKAGEAQLFQFGVGLAFLATLRSSDGAPRLHPFCPVLSKGRLYALITPASPKKDDLLHDGRYALQAFPPPRVESEEFYFSGRACLVADPADREAVLRDAKHTWHEDELVFELTLDRAMRTTWENWGTKDLRPVHTSWRATDPR